MNARLWTHAPRGPVGLTSGRGVDSGPWWASQCDHRHISCEEAPDPSDSIDFIRVVQDWTEARRASWARSLRDYAQRIREPWVIDPSSWIVFIEENPDPSEEIKMIQDVDRSIRPWILIAALFSVSLASAQTDSGGGALTVLGLHTAGSTGWAQLPPRPMMRMVPTPVPTPVPDHNPVVLKQLSEEDLMDIYGVPEPLRPVDSDGLAAMTEWNPSLWIEYAMDYARDISTVRERSERLWRALASSDRADITGASGRAYFPDGGTTGVRPPAQDQTPPPSRFDMGPGRFTDSELLDLFEVPDAWRGNRGIPEIRPADLTEVPDWVARSSSAAADELMQEGIGRPLTARAIEELVDGIRRGRITHDDIYRTWLTLELVRRQRQRVAEWRTGLVP